MVHTYYVSIQEAEWRKMLSFRQPGLQREIVSPKSQKEKLNKIYLRIISSLHVILSKGLWSHPPLNSLISKVWCYYLGAWGSLCMWPRWANRVFSVQCLWVLKLDCPEALDLSPSLYILYKQLTSTLPRYCCSWESMIWIKPFVQPWEWLLMWAFSSGSCVCWHKVIPTPQEAETGVTWDPPGQPSKTLSEECRKSWRPWTLS